MNTFWRTSATERYQRPHPSPAGVLSGFKYPFLDQPAVAQKFQQSGRFFGSRCIESIQCYLLHDSSVERLSSPRFERDFSGNERVPTLPEFINPRITFLEIPFAVGPSKKN